VGVALRPFKPLLDRLPEALSVSGPSAAVKYRKIARELQKIPARVSAEGAPAIERLWRKTYRAGQDAYGKPWAKLAPSTVARKGHDTIMVESKETYNETRVRPLSGAGLQLVTGRKAAWHLEPTANRPARPVPPLNGTPSPWKERLRKIYVAKGIEAVRRG
jgi:hypothetical protein